MKKILVLLSLASLVLSFGCSHYRKDKEKMQREEASSGMRSNPPASDASATGMSPAANSSDIQAEEASPAAVEPENDVEQMDTQKMEESRKPYEEKMEDTREESDENSETEAQEDVDALDS